MIYSHHTNSKLPANLIASMANYIGTGTADSILYSAENAIGPLPLRRICIGLLSWLKTRARLPKMKMMKISEVGSAKSDLITLIGEDTAFSLTFTIKENNVHLHEELSTAEVDEIVEIAARLYSPPRFVTAKQNT
jgi:hypothetical protein